VTGGFVEAVGDVFGPDRATRASDGCPSGSGFGGTIVTSL